MMKELVRELTEAYGPSGHEGQVREIIRHHVEDLVDRIEVDAGQSHRDAGAGRRSAHNAGRPYG